MLVRPRRYFQAQSERPVHQLKILSPDLCFGSSQQGATGYTRSTHSGFSRPKHSLATSPLCVYAMLQFDVLLFDK